MDNNTMKVLQALCQLYDIELVEATETVSTETFIGTHTGVFIWQGAKAKAQMRLDDTLEWVPLRPEVPWLHMKYGDRYIVEKRTIRITESGQIVSYWYFRAKLAE